MWVDQSLFYYFVMTIILLFPKTPIPLKVHYKLASHSSFLLILLLSLSWFWFGFWFVESNSVLQVLRWSFWLVCGWRKLALSSFVGLLIRCDLSIGF